MTTKSGKEEVGLDKSHFIPEHQQYAQRLTALEKRRAQADHPHKGGERIGHKVHKIKWYRYFTSGERVAKLVCLFGGGLLLALYVISPLSKIKQIQVVGNNELSAGQVEKATQIHPGRYIWGVYADRNALSQSAHKNNPQVKSIRVRVTGPQAVKITVQENPVVGLVEIKQRDYDVLANGQLQVAKSDKSKITYQGFGKNRTVLRKTAVQIGKVKPVIRNGISAIAYRPTKISPRRLVIYMRDGNTVYADYKTVGKKLAYYPGIAATMKDPGVVDLQVGAYSYSYGSHDK